MDGGNLFTLEERGHLLRLARSAMESRLAKRALPDVSGAPAKLRANGSCFVTLHTSDGNLRGCIGAMEAYEPLVENVVHNAINAAFRDPRFMPVSSLSELEGLELEISVLTPPEDVDGPEGFVVGEHGVIMFCSGRSAVFLPQVAPEQGWDRETTLAHLSMKAGLSPDDWRSPEARFKVFKAVVFSEKDL